jgi:hypothetical protein
MENIIYNLKKMKIKMSEKKIQIFLTSIEQDQNESFKINFIGENTHHVWGFSHSEKNSKIWQNIDKNDWVLFYFNSRYTYAGKVIKKQKSTKIAKEIFGQGSQNESLIIYCDKICEIKKGFQKTNSDMGFKSAIPEMHKIKLIQAKENSVKEIIKKFDSIEKYLGIKKNELKSKNIEKIIPSSMKKESQKIKFTVLRRIRDTVKTKKLKKLYQNKCQICNYSFPKYVKSGYSEVHHVWSMADTGDDDFDNMLVLCPNHHTEFDYKIIRFNSSKNNIIEDLEGNKIGMISFKNGHILNKKNIEFHNTEVRRTFFES